MTIQWLPVTPDSPADSDLPVTVVRSRSRDYAVWTPLVDITQREAMKSSVASCFDHDEIVYAEDWWPPLA